MLLEKIVVYFYVFKLCPLSFLRRHSIEVVDFRAIKRKQERGMSGYYKLAAEETRAIRKKSRKLSLKLWGKTVFRFVEQIECIFLYMLCEIQKSAFAV